MKFDGYDTDNEIFTRSVSEFTRQMEELMESRNKVAKPSGIERYHEACQRIRELRLLVKDIKRPKGEREGYLRELRSLERYWDVDGIPYNG